MGLSGRGPSARKTKWSRPSRDPISPTSDIKGENQSVPRYFFHLDCDGATVLDTTGAELRDPDQAWAAARATARNLMSTQAEAAVDWLTCSFSVTDETGEFVLEVPFSEVVEKDGRQQPN